MSNGPCHHITDITAVRGPKHYECEECIKTGSRWMHLRTCQECGEAIAPARLKAMPEVTTCVRCQDRLEKMSRHMASVGGADEGDESEDD